MRDSVRSELLDEVRVTTSRLPSAVRMPAPVQVVDEEALRRRGAVQVSDALRPMAGLTIKDYGGLGGIKTVSARGLGSQFSMLAIDGVAVTDCQNGQIDLDRYMVGNSSYVSFTQGYSVVPLQSAMTYVAGNLVAQESRMPRFFAGERRHVKASIEGGSFGYLSPSLIWERRLSRHLSLSLWTNYVRSDGNYPFTLSYGRQGSDSTEVKRRQNSQMWMGNADVGLFYVPSANRHLMLKVHYMQSRHNLPGPVILYNSVKASEYTQTQLFYTQGRYKMDCLPADNGSMRLHLQLLGKYRYSADIYGDTAANTPSRYLSNTYRQHEGYLSAAARFEPCRSLYVSMAQDVALSQLNSDMPQSDHVARRSSYTALSAGYDAERLSLSASVAGTSVGERALTTATGKSLTAYYGRLSPGVALTLRPWRDGPLRLRYFFKETYRVPSYNEMYFYTMPRSLNPERALQHNVGVTLMHGADSVMVRSLSFTADAYCNRVTDKIVAIPTHNMFLWSMLNFGRVDVVGLDLSAQAEAQLSVLQISLSATYTYQRALDRTSPTSKTYGHQIPYTPRHSGAASITLSTPWVDVTYSLFASGERYTLRQNTSESRIDGYVDQSVSLMRRFPLPTGSLTLQGHICNIFDVQYEVVRNYPMMGRYVKLSATYEL